MKRCGLLGRKLGHSYSPRIHEMLADYPYLLYEKEPEQLEDFLLHGDWTGLNVTIPYKKTVLPYCTELSPLAEMLGSVNTLVRRADGSIYGDNTDAYGFEQMLARLGVDYRGKKALVLGSGGASVTVQAVLRQAGAEVVVISRSGPENYENLDRHADAKLLVNTTPVGMYPLVGEKPLSLDALPALEAVLDIIYNPARTELLMQAEERGIPCEGGLFMLVAQAVRAAEQFAEMHVPAERLEQVYECIRSETENIVLIGMPGCGKSTVGALLAKETGRPLLDADAELATRLKMPVSEFIKQRGEAAFRAEETALLCELGANSGCILSTGGGCVTREENYAHLHRNGRIFWLQRDIALLPTDGRPLSQSEGVRSLYAKRAPLYARFADCVVDNNGDVRESVRYILDGCSNNGR